MGAKHAQLAEGWCALLALAVGEQLHALPGLPWLWRGPSRPPPYLRSAARFAFSALAERSLPLLSCGCHNKGTSDLAGLWLLVAGALLRFGGGTPSSPAPPKGVGLVVR